VGSTKFGSFSLTAGAGSVYTADRTGTVGIGYDKLADAEKIDVNLILGGDINDPTDLQNLKGIVENRKDAMLFVSCDVGKDGVDLNKSDSEKADKCVAFKNSIGSSSYVVIDSGYRRQFDPYNQVYRWVPLNGDTAGLVARTEANLDAWWSPAGYNRGILNNANDALSFNPNRTYRDRIYPKGVNPIISEKNSGLILLGDKTALSRPSAFDRINVRRLFIVLEKAIATASKFSLFEFNDTFTRSRFVSLITPFLEDVRSRRGIIDFKVVCNESNNTPERIDRNEFWADIYIKPNRSINYIQLNFIATRTGGNFSEIGA
jgi:phage tail sheath protein FI